MKKTNEEINVTVKEWTKAKITGNYRCPKCQEKMLIIPTMCTTMAYCFKCKQYYINIEQLERFKKSIDIIDDCIGQINI